MDGTPLTDQLSLKQHRITGDFSSNSGFSLYEPEQRSSLVPKQHLTVHFQFRKVPVFIFYDN